SPPPLFEELLPAAVRLSSRVARLIAAEAFGEGATEVRLVGEPDGTLPLLDWRALVCLEPAPAGFALGEGDPGDRAAIAAATRGSGPYEALRGDGLLVLPATGLKRTRLRALESPAVSPVPFALLDGSPAA